MAEISIRPLCPELEWKARIELGETQKKLDEGIKHLKHWIAKQPHLRARTDEQWLAAFLRGSKYSLERAKEKLDFYYTMKSIAPEINALKYCGCKFDELLRTGVILVLPKRLNPGDPRVVVGRAGQYDPDKFTLMDILAIVHAIGQIGLMDDDSFVIAGVVVVFDLTGFNTGHFAQITPDFIKKFIVVGQEGTPTRLKAVHVIGMPSYLQILFNLGKKLLNQKNRRRIRLHKNIEELHKHISPDILPEEYDGSGGRAPDIIDYWEKKIEEYRSFLNEEVKYGTDEERRPGKPRTAESLLGVDGSFRQLDFD